MRYTVAACSTYIFLLLVVDLAIIFTSSVAVNLFNPSQPCFPEVTTSILHRYDRELDSLYIVFYRESHKDGCRPSHSNGVGANKCYTFSETLNLEKSFKVIAHRKPHYHIWIAYDFTLVVYYAPILLHQHLYI